MYPHMDAVHSLVVDGSISRAVSEILCA
jgi:hypothetical protein